MTDTSAEFLPTRERRSRRILWLLRALAGDPMAVAAAIWLLIVVLAILTDSLSLLGDNRISLKARNLPPFDFSQPWTLWLGADALGRPLLVRLIQAASTTIGIAVVTVLTSLIGGTLLGVTAGYFGGVVGNVIMRICDIILGFPTLLVALFGLYLFGPSVGNLVIVLAITRMPAYIRVARAETLEVRERLFVDAARVFGGGPTWILRTHILPSVAPTMLTLASVNLAMVMLFESGLSYLGLGIQPPSVSWGLMVAQGQGYLSSAWWLGFFPGLAVMLTTMSFNLLANWFRIVNDPSQHWRLVSRRR
ncbi:ABC transporter permease [Neorhizobium galegae]|uniref:ABC transporter permease n=1 Tax=Neorhizobium galegae TaxID=399 RepID=UPI000621B537|nr:ABC transporter permease [Neorhizobium galegae]CDZ28693.1 ABC-type dipeptide/oligopeptide/nickel transport system, permease component [Neorhizobium galegae bv. officinalis]KAA9383825.1 ABC transporter permease [Neorhizobium galegae]KAB1115232.1 ABC transporter permease [Neorhizobium galegae]MCM2496894.1 ABC transporter permease [Neorhizobium galegae]MCQ1768073.1 ABC transporter permease [Neorhizobium galegae]